MTKASSMKHGSQGYPDPKLFPAKGALVARVTSTSTATLSVIAEFDSAKL